MIPNSWEELKMRIIEYCTSKDIVTLKKYVDEPWSGFITRMREVALRNGMNDDAVVYRLREMWIPEKYQILIHNTNVNLEEVIERISVWEKNSEKHFKVNRNRNEKFSSYEINLQK
jgi:hypothetical protein